MPMRRAVALAAVLGVGGVGLAGCDGARPPAGAWPQAAQGIFAGAFSADASLSIVASLNHGASVWRTADHERLYDWNHRSGAPSALVATALSPDGRRAVTTEPRTLVLWDTVTGASLGYWATPAAVLDVGLADDGRRVLLGLADHSALLFDAESGAYLQTFLHEGAVNAVDLSRDGTLAVTGSDDESVRLWDTRTGASLGQIAAGNPVRVVALSPDGRLLFAAVEGRQVVVWAREGLEPVVEISRRNPGVLSAAFSQDGRQLLVGYVNRTVELWDLETGRRADRWRTRPDGRGGGAAVLAVGFAGEAGVHYALAGDGHLVELRRG